MLIRRAIPHSDRVLSSSDYEAGELVTNAQNCKWLVGFSAMGDALNAGLKVHNLFGSSMLGMPYEQFNTLLKDKYKPCVNARQSAKCFHPDTTVLTRRGWIKIGELTYSDEVAGAVPHADGINITWQRPTNLTRRASPGTLIHLKNEGMDLRVTDDHRMLIRRQTGKWDVVTPEEVARSRGWANAGQMLEGEWKPDRELLRLAVATQADGSFTSPVRIRFGFVKQRKVERMRELLSHFPGQWREGGHVQKDTSTGYVFDFVLNKELSKRVREMLDDYKQFTWRWMDLAPDLRDLVLEECKYWDGDQPKNCRMHMFSNTSLQSVEVLQALAVISNRKTRVVRDEPHKPWHNPLYNLTIRAKPDTRGGNLECTRISYEGEVVCLSIPSSFVIAKDGGIPVIVGQCGNFGFPGFAGPVRLVHQQRGQKPDTPCPLGPTMIRDEATDEMVPGYRGTRLCILMDGAPSCGERANGEPGKTAVWNDEPISPTCLHCIQCAVRLKQAWFRQWPEMKKFFDWVSDAHKYGMTITSEALERWPWLKPFYRPGQRLKPGQVMLHFVGVLRGGLTAPSLANGMFQSLLAIAAKRAYTVASRECHDSTFRVPDMRYYNSVRSKYAGGPSPLLGSHLPAFLHDELLGDHPRSMGHDGAIRIGEVMVDELRYVCPDYAPAAKVEPCLMTEWQKGADAIVHGGRLVPWTREHKKKTCSECAAEEVRRAHAA